MKNFIKLTLFISILMVFSFGYGQKGTGESKGVAKQADIPELITFEGTVYDIKSGPCTYTVGKAVSGTHLKIRTDYKVFIDVHLGPTSKVNKFVANSKGKNIKVIVFRTERLPKDHYIAKEIELDGNKLVLRDGYLKPFWANKRGKELWK